LAEYKKFVAAVGRCDTDRQLARVKTRVEDNDLDLSFVNKGLHYFCPTSGHTFSRAQAILDFTLSPNHKKLCEEKGYKDNVKQIEELKTVFVPLDKVYFKVKRICHDIEREKNASEKNASEKNASES